MRQSIRVANGKYTFVLDGMTSTFSILRHGEPWHGPQGAAVNAIMSMMAELDAARVVVQAARDLANHMERMLVSDLQKLTDGDAFVGITRAVATHDRLVDDREPPSAWCSQ